MKKASILALVALGGLAASVSSCKKEDPAKALEVNLSQTATVNGKILVNADESDSIPKWSAPTNLSVIATVPFNQLNPASAHGVYNVTNVNYDATSGEFTVVAPVGANGTDINIAINDFAGQVRIPKMVDTVMTSEVINVLWNGTTLHASNVLPGESRTLPTIELNGAYIRNASVGEEL